MFSGTHGAPHRLTCAASSPLSSAPGSVTRSLDVHLDGKNIVPARREEAKQLSCCPVPVLPPLVSHTDGHTHNPNTSHNHIHSADPDGHAERKACLTFIFLPQQLRSTSLKPHRCLPEVRGHDPEHTSGQTSADFPP